MRVTKLKRYIIENHIGDDVLIVDLNETHPGPYVFLEPSRGNTTIAVDINVAGELIVLFKKMWPEIKEEDYVIE